MDWLKEVKEQFLIGLGKMRNSGSTICGHRGNDEQKEIAKAIRTNKRRAMNKISAKSRHYNFVHSNSIHKKNLRRKAT